MFKILKNFAIFSVAILLQTAGASAADSICDASQLADVPVLSEGRPVPLALHAARIRKAMFSGDRCDKLPASKLYCLLSLGKKQVLETEYACRLQLKADHPATFELLGLSGRGASISPELALANQQKLLSQYHLYENQGKSSSGPASDLGGLLTRIDRYNAVVEGSDWRVLTLNHEWITVSSLIARSPDGFANALLESPTHLTGDEAQLMNFEKLYERTHPFIIAIAIALIGFVSALGASKSNMLELTARFSMIALIATELFGITLRVLISGRAPVTNMFETVMWVGFVVLVLSFVLGLTMKNRTIWAAGFSGNVISLFMLNFATGMLDNSIQPLVPVLRDNFWLSTHVTSITSSYACFAFSWLIANMVLLRRLLGHSSSVFLDRWNHVIRVGMQIGTVMLAAGVILGGVWADYSWGRFWGWDPKETWSLIALIIYIGILHGRYVGWFRGARFTIMASGAFLSIIMAWFGVNYILAVGLHSYGFSSGGATFITTIAITQCVVIGLSLARGNAPGGIKAAKT